MTLNIFNSIISYDRQFIDRSLEKVDIAQFSVGRQWQAYRDIGLAYYDLGFRDEGISYLEKSFFVADQNSSFSIPLDASLGLLTYQMNDEKYGKKRLEYALAFVQRCAHDKEFAKVLLLKSHINLRQFEEAEQIINNLVSLNPVNKNFWPQFYYAKGDYQLAADHFCRYPLDRGQYDWHIDFDYKEAVSYFKTDQLKKWQDKATKIGRRLTWDKFYKLDYLEDEGVERIPEIDQVIELSRQKKKIIYVDKLSLCLRRMPWVLWKTYLMYPYEALFIAAGSLFLIMLIRAFLKYA